MTCTTFHALTACACAAFIAIAGLPTARGVPSDATIAMPRPRLAARAATMPVFDPARVSPSFAPRRDTRIAVSAGGRTDAPFATSFSRRDNRMAVADAGASQAAATL